MFDMNVQCFYAVAESGSFSRAAELLFLTQPSVSRNVKVLEAELGYSLFVRTTRSVRLTKQGEMLFGVLQKALKVWHTGLDEIATTGRELRGRLRVGLLSTWVVDRMPIFDVFQQQHPNVQIEIHKFRYMELVEKLLDGSLDIIFTIVEENFEQYLATHDPRIASRKLFRVPMLICVSLRHPEAGRAASVAELGEMELLVLDEDHPSAWRVNSTLVADHNWNLTLVPSPNVESIVTGIDRHQGCALSPLVYLGLNYRSRYKTFATGLELDALCCWSHETDNRAMVEAFIRTLEVTGLEKTVNLD